MGVLSKKIASAALLGVGAALSACGGNGGGSPPTLTQAPAPPQAQPAPPPQDFDTSEFRSQPALEQINVIPAYEEGASGAGVIVSIIDTGIDVNNPEFAGRIHPDSADLVTADVVGAADARSTGPSLQDEDDHGTPIASIIGAARNDVGLHGVAPESELLVFRTDDESDNQSLLFGAAIGEAVDRSATIGAGVINMSFGSNDGTARADFANLFTFTQAQDMVVVIAAGNDGAPDPDLSAQGALDVSGAPTTIVAGAVNSSNNMPMFSNRAGVAKDIYLVAPGVLIPAERVGADNTFSGTSASTPHIVGAVALLRDLWPQLDAGEIVEILLDSATDLGDPGTDPVYGRGLLNVGAAVSPSGTVTTTSVDGAVSEAGALQGQLSGAFGASLSGLGDIVVFDSYNRHFRASLDGAVAPAAPARFDIEAAFSPFEDRVHATRRVSEGLTARMRLTSRDRSLTDFSAHQVAAFSGADMRSPLVEDELAVSLMSDLGEGRSLTVAQGFSARTADAFGVETRRTPFLSESAFADGFLPVSERALSGLVSAPLTKRLSADMLVAHAYDFYADDLLFADAPRPFFDDRSASVMRVGLNVRLADAVLRVEQGVLQENGAILGATFDGGAGASTVYAAFEADWAFSPLWRFKGRFSAGRTFAQTDGFGQLIDEFSDLTTSQFSLSLVRDRLLNRHDSLWLGVSQPLRIEGGAALVTLPTAYDPFTDTIAYTTRRAPLSPDGRQYDIEAGYRLFMGPFGTVDVNVIHQLFADETEAATTLFLRGGFDL